MAGLEGVSSAGTAAKGVIGGGGPVRGVVTAGAARSVRGFGFGFTEFGSNGLNGLGFFAKRFHLSDGLRYCRPLITLAVGLWQFHLRPRVMSEFIQSVFRVEFLLLKLIKLVAKRRLKSNPRRFQFRLSSGLDGPRSPSVQ